MGRERWLELAQSQGSLSHYPHPDAASTLQLAFLELGGYDPTPRRNHHFFCLEIVLSQMCFQKLKKKLAVEKWV